MEDDMRWRRVEITIPTEQIAAKDFQAILAEAEGFQTVALRPGWTMVITSLSNTALAALERMRNRLHIKTIRSLAD